MDILAATVAVKLEKEESGLCYNSDDDDDSIVFMGSTLPDTQALVRAMAATTAINDDSQVTTLDDWERLP